MTWNLRRFQDWLRGSPSGLVVLALVVGAGAGGGAVGFRYLILGFTYAFSGHRDYSAAGHASYGYIHALGPWFVVLVPVVGGLLYGPLIYFFAREARGHGVPEVMFAVAERGGRIRPQVAVVKSLASAICIGSGGSVGREGPIVQIGSALGSTVAQTLRLPESRIRILVACGAAAGISATFNAPIAGVFFALELILRDFEADSFGVVVLSSLVADIIGRAAFGSHPFLNLPGFQLRSPLEYPLYAGLGLLAALVGIAFIRVLYGTEDLADRLWHGPEWLRPAAGGLLLGLVLLILPELYGVGYPPLEKAIHGNYIVWLLLALLAGKILATSLTIAIGGSGGVFAPSLFIGAMLGSAYGSGMHHLFPGITAPAGTYGLVGMGAVFAAAARAPITAVIIIFELTGDYRIILPLMFAIVLASGTSKLLSPDTIYTLKLRRRGIDLMRGRRANPMQRLTVEDAMRPLSKPLSADTPLNDVIARLANDPDAGFHVIGADGHHLGTVGSEQVEQALRDSTIASTAGDLAVELPTLTTDQTLEDALASLVHARSGLPVRDPNDDSPLGWLTHSDVLNAYNQQLEQPQQPSDSTQQPQVYTRADLVRARLRGYRIIDLELADGQPLVGQRVNELAWPADTTILAIRRADRTLPAQHDVMLEQGDRITLLVPGDAAESLIAAVTPPR